MKHFKWVLEYVARLHFVSWIPVIWWSQNAYFSLLIHAKKLSSVTFCDAIARIKASFRTDVEVEIVIKIYKNVLKISTWIHFLIVWFLYGTQQFPAGLCTCLCPIQRSWVRRFDEFFFEREIWIFSLEFRCALNHDLFS